MINLWQSPLLRYLNMWQLWLSGLFLFLLLASLLVLPAGCYSENNGADHVSNKNVSEAQNTGAKLAGNTGQDHVLVLASGKTVSMLELKESVVLVNFWAIWCAPCRIEIPELNILHNKYQVKVLGIDFDRREGQELRSAITDMDINFPVLSAQSATELNFDWPEALPATLVVVNLQVAETLLGPQTSESLTKAIHRAHNKVGPPGVVSWQSQ